MGASHDLIPGSRALTGSSGVVIVSPWLGSSTTPRRARCRAVRRSSRPAIHPWVDPSPHRGAISVAHGDLDSPLSTQVRAGRLVVNGSSVGMRRAGASPGGSATGSLGCCAGAADPMRDRHRRPQLREPCVPVAVAARKAIAVVHERPPYPMGHQARQAHQATFPTPDRDAQRLPMPRTCWITDPDGYRIEVLQWPDGHADGITKADFA